MKLVLRIRSVYGDELVIVESHADVSRGWVQTMRVPGIQDGAFKVLRDRLDNHVRRYGGQRLPDDLFPFLMFEAELVPES